MILRSDSWIFFIYNMSLIIATLHDSGQICEFRDLGNILQIHISSWFDSCLKMDLGILSYDWFDLYGKRQIYFRIISGVKGKLVNNSFVLLGKILLLSSKVVILILVNTEANWSEKHLIILGSLLTILFWYVVMMYGVHCTRW